MEQIKPGIYKHYKGKLYEVIGVATMSGTEGYSDEMKIDNAVVVYRPLYGDYGLRHRAYRDFCGTVQLPTPTKDCDRVLRFRLIQGF